MARLRADFLTETITSYAERRGGRPIFFKPQETDLSQKECPFCLENLSLLEKETYASDNKRVRVYMNKYPAFEQNSDTSGFHEVLVDTPNHDEKLADFSIEDISAVFEAIKNRMNFYKNHAQIKYIQVIKNDGRYAGASVYHSHWQLFIADFVPTAQLTISKNFSRYHEQTQSCFLCDIKQNAGTLKICENELFFAYSPYASAYAHMVNIAPKNHVSDFTEFSEEDFFALANILKTILNALRIVKENLSYNICFQNALNVRGHFFIQIIPRTSGLAGFELATGCFLNATLPENSCAELKKIIEKT